MASMNLARTFCGPPLCAAGNGGIQLSTITTTATSHRATTSRATVSTRSTSPIGSQTNPLPQPVRDSSTILSTSPSSTDSPSLTYYVCDEPMVTGTVTDWMQVRIPGSVYDKWANAMSTAAPQTALLAASANPSAFLASLEHEIKAHHPPSWFKAMPTAARSVFVSFWMPQYDPMHAISTGLAQSSDYQKYFPTSYQASLLYTNETNLPSADGLSNKNTGWKNIVIGVSLPFAAVLVFFSVWYIIRLRSRRRKRQDEEQPPSSSGKRNYKRDYNAKPLFPHKPLARLSETSFTTDPGPSYGSMSKPANDGNDEVDGIAVPNLPELQGSPTEETGLLPALASSDDDFGTHFSGLEDPFSDDQHINIAELPSTVPESRVRGDVTPGVSPSSSSMRDRLSHESGRRRQAFKAVKGQVTAGQGSWTGSVGEEDLKKLGKAFESREEGKTESKILRESKSVDDVAGKTKTGDWHELKRSSSSRVTSWGEGEVGEAVEVIIRKLNRAK